MLQWIENIQSLFNRQESESDSSSGQSFEPGKTSLKPSLKPEHTTCLIDVGGGLRGVYAAGVLERLMDENIQVDLCIGVSAGSANLATYIAKQKGRLYAYYHEYGFRQEYASIHNYLTKRSFFDMDYIYGTLSNSDGEYPLDYSALIASPTQLITVATNALTGRPVYLGKEWISQDDYALIKGSCSVPYLCTTNSIANLPFCDGTVSDPIPVQQALDRGADRIVILFPRPVEEDKPSKAMELTIELAARFSEYGRSFPAVHEALKVRMHKNNESLQLALKLQEEGKLLFVFPKTLHDVKSLGGSPDAVQGLYDEGYQDGRKAADFLLQP
ncbi:patatin family protein [Allobaculum sp. JKK-2023]|uniref:patatin-like phospholipase family protein n=1 Tax=Allobaculum sp. JKK-2023 TaxID=3108943 RepID=UPI002B061D07|nr:patatin family protein [Allobaculum sp. JKK-2023]